MLVVNIAEAKAKLSEFLDAVAHGERVLICKRNQPIAELRALESARTEPRPIGVGRDAFQVPESFFEPLPDAFVDDFFEAGGSVPFGVDANVHHDKVAEGGLREPYGSSKPGKRGRKA